MPSDKFSCFRAFNATLLMTWGAISLATLGGCQAKLESDVVLYGTVDDEVASPIIGAFERSNDQTVGVRTRFSQGVGMEAQFIESILNDAMQPTPDVVWNESIFETLELERAGRLLPRSWPTDPMWPSDMIARDGSWCGFAVTARVLVVNKELIRNEADFPRSILDLADPKWAGKCGLSDPAEGKSAVHMAVLRERMGRDAALKWLNDVRASAVVMERSYQVLSAVSRGQLAWGLTDSDLAAEASDRNKNLAIVFPDQDSSQFGTLRIPSTVAVLANAEHPNAAGALADYLVSPQTEDRLAMGNGSHLPLNQKATFPPRILSGEPVRWMQTDFRKAAENREEWEASVRAVVGDVTADAQTAPADPM